MTAVPAATPQQTPAAAYRGRFAPTPSGPLHLGSLLTALAGWLQARAAGGQWWLRFDDLDAARCRPQHIDAILRQLEAHALHWHGAPRLQSRHHDEYADAFVRLRADDALYPCICTRAQLAAGSAPGPDGPVYPGTCRLGVAAADVAAWRFAAGAGQIELEDPWRGALRRDIARDIGDFVVWRADGTPGYQLACVIDEAAMAVDEVVRGTDLVGSSLRQLLLQRRLGLPAPRYAHLPVLTGAGGRKLSKQNSAAPVTAQQAGEQLWLCLELLRQEPPPALRGAAATEILEWAQAHWRPQRLPAASSIALPPAVLGTASAHLAS